jgi:hypothetical protein
MAQKKKYASVKNPTIEAILNENFRFSDTDQAQTRLEALRETFITSRLPEDVDADPKELKLWIRGYGLSSSMREKGYIGNYARFEVKRAEKGKWTITAVLLSIDKKYHPQRRQPPRRHPNWGHPIMRDIKKQRVHAQVETAQNELARLHELFPEVSIPLTNKMYIMVYQKTEDGEPPIKKWVLEIKATEDGGGFYIDSYPNTYQADTRAVVQEATAKKEPAIAKEAMGKFTSAALLKKSRKTAPIIQKKTETEE